MMGTGRFTFGVIMHVHILFSVVLYAFLSSLVLGHPTRLNQTIFGEDISEIYKDEENLEKSPIFKENGSELYKNGSLETTEYDISLWKESDIQCQQDDCPMPSWKCHVACQNNSSERSREIGNKTNILEIEKNFSLTDKEDEVSNFTSASPREPRAKLQLYQDVINSLLPVVGEYDFEIWSCKNRCGMSTACSCKPSCVYLRTCCIDFLEACQHLYDESHFQRLQWLQSVKFDCIDYNVVVTSCYKDDISYPFSNVSALADDEEPASNVTSMPYVDFLRNYFHSFNDTQELTLVEVLMFLVSIPSQDFYVHLGRVERMMLTTPVMDMSTGISYLNILVYHCNGADLSTAVPQDIDWPLNPPDIMLSSRIKKFQDILDILPRKKMCNMRTTRDIFLKHKDQCHESAIDFCPESFGDQDVKDACRDIVYFLTVWRVNDSVEQVLKNPFCLLCQSFRPIEYDMIHSGFMSNSRSCDYNILFMVFDQFLSQKNFYIRVFSNFPNDSVMQAWQSLACVFQPPSAVTYQSKTAFSPGAGGLLEGETHLRTRCFVHECREQRKGAYCVSLMKPMVLLPPTRYDMTDSYLAEIRDEMLQMFLQSIPTASNDSNHTRAYHVVQDSPVSFNGPLQFKYFFYFEFYGEIVLNKYLKLSIRHLLVDLLLEAGFPYTYDHNYLYLAEKGQSPDAIEQWALAYFPRPESLQNANRAALGNSMATAVTAPFLACGLFFHILTV